MNHELIELGRAERKADVSRQTLQTLTNFGCISYLVMNNLFK